MGNGCSASGGWFLKALEHEYIDRRVFLVVSLFGGKGFARMKQVGRLEQVLGLHWMVTEGCSLVGGLCLDFVACYCYLLKVESDDNIMRVVLVGW